MNDDIETLIREAEGHDWIRESSYEPLDRLVAAIRELQAREQRMREALGYAVRLCESIHDDGFPNECGCEACEVRNVCLAATKEER